MKLKIICFAALTLLAGCDEGSPTTTSSVSAAATSGEAAREEQDAEEQARAQAAAARSSAKRELASAKRSAEAAGKRFYATLTDFGLQRPAATEEVEETLVYAGQVASTGDFQKATELYRAAQGSWQEILRGLDRVAPELRFEPGKEIAIVDQPDFLLEGTIRDATAVEVTVNGREATLFAGDRPGETHFRFVHRIQERSTWERLSVRVVDRAKLVTCLEAKVAWAFSADDARYLAVSQGSEDAKRHLLEELTLSSDRKAAVQAMFDLGCSYEEAEVTQRDTAKAEEWFLKAAHASHLESMLTLASNYQHGQGVPRDHEKANHWYEQAALSGDTYSMVQLARNYAAGKGATQSYALANLWFSKAAELGNTSGMIGLGESFAEGRGVAQSYAIANSYYCEAVQRGDSEAACKLALNCSLGRGVQKSQANAVLFYRSAARRGNPLAMLELGRRFEEGEGLEQSHERANQWYQKAADRGNTDAMEALGRNYKAGRGVARDVLKGNLLLCKASVLKSKRASSTEPGVFEVEILLPR